MFEPVIDLSPQIPPLTATSVHVWCVDLTQAKFELATIPLSAAELERAQRLRRPSDRQRFCCHRMALRQILSHYVGWAPAALEFATATHGKPYLAAPTQPMIQFNGSHSGDLALYAIAQHPLGVDIEQERSVASTALAHRYFQPSEVAWLTAQPRDRQQTAFFQLWTAKEAYLKATGRGLGGLKTVTVTIQPEPQGWALTSTSSAEDTAWYLQPLQVRPGYHAAIVTSFWPTLIQCWSWPPT